MSDNKTQHDDAQGMRKYGDLGCMRCGSHDSEQTGSELINGQRYVKMHCNSCGHSWKKPE